MPPTHARIHRARRSHVPQRRAQWPCARIANTPARPHSHTRCFSAGPNSLFGGGAVNYELSSAPPPPPPVRALRCNNVSKPHYERIMQLLNFIPALLVDEIASPVASAPRTQVRKRQPAPHLARRPDATRGSFIIGRLQKSKQYHS
jgi:hypothetical protein